MVRPVVRWDEGVGGGQGGGDGERGGGGAGPRPDSEGACRGAPCTQCPRPDSDFKSRAADLGAEAWVFRPLSPPCRRPPQLPLPRARARLGRAAAGGSHAPGLRHGGEKLKTAAQCFKVRWLTWTDLESGIAPLRSPRSGRIPCQPASEDHPAVTSPKNRQNDRPRTSGSEEESREASPTELQPTQNRARLTWVLTE
jgi:hypothetical protein